jgi:3-hydroxyisobutyrate dehydrogenase
MSTPGRGEDAARVAVIGTGTMGTAVAVRLLRAGHRVDVWSRHVTSTGSSVNAGAVAHASVTDAVSRAEVVVTMLPNADVTARVMFDDAAVDTMAPSAIWVQMATIGVAHTEELAARVDDRRPDVAFVDAPVSGSRGPAESGDLLILGSGPRSAAATLEPVFDALGRKTMWLGAAGAGSRLKLVLNTWLAFQTEGAAESASLAEVLGVDPGSLLDALDGNALASPYALAKLHRMLEKDFRPDFSIDLALKDLELVSDEAGTDAAPVAAVIAERWRRLVEGGSRGLDVSAAARDLGDPGIAAGPADDASGVLPR